MSMIGNKRAAESWRHVLSTIGAGEEVSPEGIRFAMDQIMSGASGDVHTATFAFGLLAKGITPAELEAAAEGMLSFARPVDDPKLADAISRGAVDIVGTGGDGAHTVNISTMSMVAIAACGVPVLKHGNRAASSKSGGADMLEACGIDIEDGVVASPEHPEFYLRFLFAARYHPAMRFAGPVRKELAVPTVFNLLGPLTNPARPQASLIGCAFEDLMETMAGTFARRGQRALVVRGSDGLDEITVTGPTKVFIVENGAVTEDVIDPHDFGMEYSEAGALRGGDPAYNADVARRIWSGELEGPIRDAVILNSAAAIAISRGLDGRPLKDALADAINEVETTLKSGLCMEIVAAAVKG
ncbi:MAG: anthranilate phosphoribosyltransferase [Corynebacterium sp.]|uniref:anthranilate phosphoribosyltransferase n=1 Tax=Corynebacterium sp. TaxID=1720 RepID=UPI0026DCBE51|nr:anthranilate phosphoribosyltransferase [Corynebacterium sp.]MDO5029670.1 anthranilate phosphoribosyltransferase [Corynebacterium sp.]